MIFIPLGDVYRLTVQCGLPGADEFDCWIFDEVLPSIYKHGGYILGQEVLDEDQLLAKAVLVAQRKIAEKDKQIAEQKQLIVKQEGTIAELQPAKVFADAVSASETSILIGELAKLLKQNSVDIGQNRLFDWMRQNGYLVRRNGTGRNMPTQRAMEMGLFEIKKVTVHVKGRSIVRKTTMVTGKGQQYFVQKFLSGAAVACP